MNNNLMHNWKCTHFFLLSFVSLQEKKKHEIFIFQKKKKKKKVSPSKLHKTRIIHLSQNQVR
jgi:hypothetical protein